MRSRLPVYSPTFSERLQRNILLVELNLVMREGDFHLVSILTLKVVEIYPDNSLVSPQKWVLLYLSKHLFLTLTSQE